tara:strand:- start:5577 stop:6194 length:618 start_codon:yes stop_codon:yes gene_type:complete
MSSIKKIQELLKFSKKKTYKIKMYAEAILDDARVIATDSDAFDMGAEVYVINDAGEVESLAEGIYTLEDGTKIRIDADSRVAGYGEEEEEIVEEEVVEEELAVDDGKEADVDDWAGMEKRIQNLEDAIADIKRMIGEGDDVEMSNDVMGEMLTKIDNLETKLSKMEETPSSDGLKVTPNETNAIKTNLSKMTTKERIAYIINNKK